MKTLTQTELTLIAGGEVSIVVPRTHFDLPVPHYADIQVTAVCVNYDVAIPIYNPFGHIVDYVYDSLQTCT